MERASGRTGGGGRGGRLGSPSPKGKQEGGTQQEQALCPGQGTCSLAHPLWAPEEGVQDPVRTPLPAPVQAEPPSSAWGAMAAVQTTATRWHAHLKNAMTTPWQRRWVGAARVGGSGDAGGSAGGLGVWGWRGSWDGVAGLLGGLLGGCQGAGGCRGAEGAGGIGEPAGRERSPQLPAAPQLWAPPGHINSEP